MQDGGTDFLGRLQAVFLVGGSDSIDQEAIPVDEVLELVANRVASASDSDRFHHARVPQLFTAQLAVEQLERERNVLFNDALNTFYLRLYGVRHMVKDHSDSEKGNPLPPHRLLLSINSKGSLICTIPQKG